ncbi:MAG: hypothetical protein AAGN46_09135 [Acidobacteriota bacterium]
MSNGSQAPPPPPPGPSAPPAAPAAPSYAPPPPAKKEGLPTWAKIGLGCGCLALLVAAALVATCTVGVKKAVEKVEGDPGWLAEMAINANPELEVVDRDPDAGTFTIRNTTTGETQTLDYSEIAEGKFRMEGSDGETFEINAAEAGETGGMTIRTGDGETRIGGDAAGDMPSWVVLLDGAESTQVVFSASQGGKQTGMLNQQVADDIDALDARLRSQLEAAGFTIERSELTSGEGKNIGLRAKRDDRSLTYALTRSAANEPVAVMITYEGP